MTDRPIDRLIAVMAALRDPETGCPWDIEQDFASIAPYTVEEAYEVADAIARDDMADLRGELGDLLLQVVFHAQMAREAGYFDFDQVAEAVTDKMISRHPHVFGTLSGVDSPDATIAVWEQRKADERAAKRRQSVLDDIALALPALMRAEKLQKRAARVGFDWDDAARVLEKVVEEARELSEATAQSAEAQAEEYGDLLFTLVNLGRHLKLDPEASLQAANAKFEQRFRAIEAALAAQGRTMETASLAEMEALWQQVKAVGQQQPG